MKTKHDRRGNKMPKNTLPGKRRVNRRAEDRLSARTRGYLAMVASAPTSKNGTSPYTKPGAIDRY